MNNQNQEATPVGAGGMQGGNRTYENTCKACGTKNTFIVPQYEILNSFGCSMLIFPHPEPQYCEKCNAPYQMVLKVVEGIGIVFMKLKDQKGSVIDVYSADALSKLPKA